MTRQEQVRSRAVTARLALLDQGRLQELLDRIGDGSIVDGEELEEEDVRILLAHFGPGEALPDILDRLRGASRDER